MQFGLKSNNRVSTSNFCSVVQQATWMAMKFEVKARKGTESGVALVSNMVSTTLHATAWQLRFLPRMSVWYTGFQCGTLLVITVVHSVVLLDVSLTQSVFMQNVPVR